MIDQNDKISDKEISEEDLLDFELDDLSPDELVDSGSGESDDILELVDLVEQGKKDKLKDSFEGEIAELMKEDEDVAAPTAKISGSDVCNWSSTDTPPRSPTSIPHSRARSSRGRIPQDTIIMSTSSTSPSPNTICST